MQAAHDILQRRDYQGERRTQLVRRISEEVFTLTVYLRFLFSLHLHGKVLMLQLQLVLQTAFAILKMSHRHNE